MKSIKDTINESKTSIAKIYENTIFSLCDVLANAPYGSYTLDSGDCYGDCKDLLEALKYDNKKANSLSMNGKLDPSEISNIGDVIGKQIAEALHKSCNNHYDAYSSEE